MLGLALGESRSERVKDSNGRKAQVGNENCDILETCPMAEGGRGILSNEERVKNRVLEK